MLKIAIMGNGRMGTLVRSTAETMCDADGAHVFEVVAQFGFDLSGIDDAPAADVLIDFSNVGALPAVISYVQRCGCALVSGTTGYGDDELDAIRALGANAPVVWSGNYSIGVAALRHLTAQATRELPGFDVEIVECHHNQKADAPSGTAKMLLDEVMAARADEVHAVYGRQGMCGARDAHEVGVHALRGGTVAGVHTVSLFGTDEEVSLTHRATSRQIFVNGALAAAAKLAVREPGFYTFDELMF